MLKNAFGCRASPQPRGGDGKGKRGREEREERSKKEEGSAGGIASTYWGIDAPVKHWRL